MREPICKGEDHYGRSLAYMDLKELNSPWRSVLPLARQFRRAKGEQLPMGKELLFLERGKVCLVFEGWDGTEKIIWYIHAGCIIGIGPFFDPMPNAGMLVCASDCVLYAFSAQAIERISRERPDLMLNLFHIMARKIRILSYHVSSLCLDDALVRICKFLEQRLVPDSSPLTAKIGISRQEMANLLGMHRISLYRTLRQQEERGLFGPIRGKNITILRPDEFYQLAGK